MRALLINQDLLIFVEFGQILTPSHGLSIEDLDQFGDLFLTMIRLLMEIDLDLFVVFELGWIHSLDLHERGGIFELIGKDHEQISDFFLDSCLRRVDQIGESLQMLLLVDLRVSLDQLFDQLKTLDNSLGVRMLIISG